MLALLLLLLLSNMYSLSIRTCPLDASKTDTKISDSELNQVRKEWLQFHLSKPRLTPLLLHFATLWQFLKVHCATAKPENRGSTD